jgi:hypothetical protein
MAVSVGLRWFVMEPKTAEAWRAFRLGGQAGAGVGQAVYPARTWADAALLVGLAGFHPRDRRPDHRR